MLNQSKQQQYEQQIIEEKDDLDKKQKRKEVARICRLKKKKYINQLEQTIQGLQRQLQQVKQNLTNSKSKLSNILLSNGMNNSFDHQEKQTYARLEQVCSNQQADEDQINLLLDVLTNRVGATGKQRKRKVIYYGDKLINFSFPAIYRYILICSKQKADIFGFQQNNFKWTKDLRQALQLNEQQIIELNNIQNKVEERYDKTMQKIISFKQMNENVYQITMKIEQQIIHCRRQLSPKQNGKIIVQIEKRKYNKDVQVDIEPHVRKKVKLN